MATPAEDVQVRGQLASTAKRISADLAMPIIQALLHCVQDTSDPHMPLMIWWALEAHADARPQIESMLQDQGTWRQPMFRQHIASRLMQRYAASGSTEDLQFCAKLLALAPDDDSKRQLMIGLNRAFQGRSIPPLPQSLESELRGYQSKLGDAGLMLRIRQGDPQAVARAIEFLTDRSADLVLQLEIAKTFGEVDQSKVVPTLIRLATGGGTGEPSLQRVAIRSLVQYDNSSIASSLVGAFGSQISDEHGLRDTACRTLASRPEWASVLLAELNAWRLRRDNVPADVVQQLRTYQQPEIVAQVERAFGKAVSASAPQQIAEINRVKTIVSKSPGNAESGKSHFVKLCANCHQLFGEGKKVGPPLDGYQRGDQGFWLNAIVVPSLEVREGFQSYLALTTGGRAINGMIAAQDDKTVTLRNADNQLTVLDRDQIETLRAIPTSLMPVELLKEMSDESIRDLFAYLSLQNR
jgi:putative heme-binding domain-containing protein